MRKIIRKLSYRIAKNKIVFYVAQRLAFDHLGENNSDIETNGERKILDKYLPQAKTVFDVGANIGDWTADALAINPSVKIVSFEPVAETFEILKNRKFVGNCKLENIALSNLNGDIDFFVYENSVLNSAEKREGVAVKKIEKVKTVRLDDYCKEAGVTEIDFLKIDVEGFEFDVLKGAEDMLAKKKIHALQFEYGGTFLEKRLLFKDVYDYLNNLGYNVAKIHFDRVEFIEMYEQKLDDFQNANFLAVPK